jgi:outer membrane protein OmpA-like peptidoglycan-associated protein
MWRPGSGSGGHRDALVRLVLATVAALACASMAADLARAAAQHASASLSAAASNRNSPSPDRKLAGNLDEAFGPEQRAQELYLDAMEKLDAGRDEWAQKTFEDLVARFPQSTAAALARRQLGALYQRGGPRVATPAPDAPRKLAAPVASPETAAPVAMAIGASPAWEQELRRNSAIQTRLRNEAGDRVFFSAGSAELGSRARSAITAQAQWLNRWHEFEAAIEGHADESGSDQENLKLSERRAEAVRLRLVEEGVEASRLAIVAQGRTQRIAICAGVDCAAQNRRAVTLVFASGTRERLGLTAPVPMQALDAPQALAPEPAATANTPAVAERVGVAR